MQIGQQRTSQRKGKAYSPRGPVMDQGHSVSHANENQPRPSSANPFRKGFRGATSRKGPGPRLHPSRRSPYISSSRLGSSSAHEKWVRKVIRSGFYIPFSSPPPIQARSSYQVPTRPPGSLRHRTRDPVIDFQTSYRGSPSRFLWLSLSASSPFPRRQGSFDRFSTSGR